MASGELFDICGVGTAAVDDLLFVDRYPGADEKAVVLEERRRFGGLVATALATASRLGARTAYAGALTDDQLGVAVRDALSREGVDCRWTSLRPDGCTIHSVIVSERSAPRRTIFYSSARDYPPDAIDAASIVSSCRVLLVDQLGIAVAREARRRGTPVVADMEWPEWADRAGFLAVVDHLLVSRSFAAALTGEGDPGGMARALQGGSGRACTAVTCGAEGCYYVGPGGGVLHAPAVAVRAVQTNGCGDVFHGAYAVALCRGWGVPECIRYASSAAALFASRPGGWQCLPTHAELAALGG